MDHILLTGASGLLGKRIQQVLKTREVHLTCLDRHHGYDLTNPSSFYPLFKSGIEPPISHVIHAGACTSFSPNKQKIFSVNVQGTKYLADACNNLLPPLKRFVYVSSAWQGEDLNVPYTHSKQVAEEFLLGKSDMFDQYKANFPVTIVRPSILFDQQSTSIIWMFLLTYALGQGIVDLQSKFDAVEASYAAEAIVNITLKDSLKTNIYNISSNYPTQTLDRIFRGFDDFFSRQGVAHELDVFHQRYIQVSQKQLTELIYSSNLDDKMKKICDYALRTFVPVAAKDRLFDNTDLINEGISRPPPLVSYLKQVLEYTTNFSMEEMIEFEMKD
jgi:dTDP-4-dehydrorhamnose reductase